MSLKNMALAFASVLVLSGSAFAGDLMDDLQNMNLDTINDSAASVEEFDLASLDMDGLAENAGEEADTDAIEACFRRFGGYRGGGWSHWGGYRSYGHCYRNYSYSCYRPLYCYRPVVSCYTHCLPVVTSYWGCY